MKGSDSEKIIQDFKNLKEVYFKDLNEEEIEKINEVERILVEGKSRSYSLFYERKEKELARKKITILGRCCEILYQMLREGRASRDEDTFKEVSELILSDDQGCYIKKERVPIVT